MVSGGLDLPTLKGGKTRRWRSLWEAGPWIWRLSHAELLNLFGSRESDIVVFTSRTS